MVSAFLSLWLGLLYKLNPRGQEEFSTHQHLADSRTFHVLVSASSHVPALLSWSPVAVSIDWRLCRSSFHTVALSFYTCRLRPQSPLVWAPRADSFSRDLCPKGHHISHATWYIKIDNSYEGHLGKLGIICKHNLTKANSTSLSLCVS